MIRVRQAPRHADFCRTPLYLQVSAVQKVAEGSTRHVSGKISAIRLSATISCACHANGHESQRREGHRRAGIDAVVAQGYDAGGHRRVFALDGHDHRREWDRLGNQYDAKLLPLHTLLVRHVFLSRVVQTDVTTIPVLDPESGKTRTGRYWVYLGDRPHPFTVFDYTPSRARDGPEAFLGAFEGYLQADAYSGYDAIFAKGKIHEVGWWRTRDASSTTRATPTPRACTPCSA
jgi:hypothetical protein